MDFRKKKKDGRGGRRPGAGRPRTSVMAGSTSTELPADLLEAVRARAVLEGCSVPDLTRRALRLYLRSTEATDRYAVELALSEPGFPGPPDNTETTATATNPLDRAAGTKVLP